MPVRTDSEAARSFVNRRGLGRMRHIEVRELGLHEEVRKGEVVVQKVSGVENPAGLMTEVLGGGGHRAWFGGSACGGGLR